MRYVARGEVPAKRHAQFRDNGRLLVEEVMGYEGFSGNESILYHHHSPCRIDAVGGFRRSPARSGRPIHTSTGSPA
jgi:homogentisate 1,2-dioxygenase